MTSNIICIKVTDGVTSELISQSSSSLNRVREFPSSEILSELKDNFSVDSLDKQLILSKKYIIIPSTSTDDRHSLNVSQTGNPFKNIEYNIPSINPAYKENFLNTDFKPHPQNILKADRHSSSSMISGIYSLFLGLLKKC